jgi:hypothetical protein
MAALSAAEHLVSLSPTMPYSVEVDPRSEFDGAIGVALYFHRNLPGLVEFAGAMGVETSARPHGDGTQVHTSAQGELAGVPFLGWVLEAAPRVSLVREPLSGAA